MLSRSKIWSYGRTLSLLSNSMSRTKIRFFNIKLCQIPHNDLVMEWFSRSNLYEIPHVMFQPSALNLIQDIPQSCTFSHFLWNLNLILQKKVMKIFPRSLV